MAESNPIDKIRSLLGNAGLSPADVDKSYHDLATVYEEVTGERMEDPATRDRYHESLAGLDILKDTRNRPANLPAFYRAFLETGGIPQSSPAMILRKILIERQRSLAQDHAGNFPLGHIDEAGDSLTSGKVLVEKLRSLLQDYARKIPLSTDHEKRHSLIRGEALISGAADAIEEGLLPEDQISVISRMLPLFVTESCTELEMADIGQILQRVSQNKVDPSIKAFLIATGAPRFQSRIAGALRTVLTFHLGNLAYLTRAKETGKKASAARLKNYAYDLFELSAATPLAIYEGRASLMESALDIITYTDIEIELNYADFNDLYNKAIRVEFTTTLERYAEIYFQDVHHEEDGLDQFLNRERKPFELVEATINLFEYPVFHRGIEKKMASIIRKYVGSLDLEAGQENFDDNFPDINETADVFDRLLQLYEETVNNGLVGEEAERFVAQSPVAREIEKMAAAFSGEGNTGGPSGTPETPPTESSGPSGPAGPIGSASPNGMLNMPGNLAQTSMTPAGMPMLIQGASQMAFVPILTTAIPTIATLL